MSGAKKGGGGGKGLDDLMMAYADLNAPSKNHGFKGPPVKDIRREAKSVSYQPSVKARNWRTLDQSLENAFTKDTQSLTGVPSLNPVGDIGSFFHQSPSLPPSQGTDLPSASPMPAQRDDEWGDFQAFSSPNLDYSSNSVFNTTPNQSSNQPNSTPHSQSNMFANNLSVLSPNQPIGLTSNQPTQLTVLAPNQPTVFAHNPPTALAHNKPTLAAPKSTLFSSTPNLASGLQFQFPPSSLPPPPAIQPTPQGNLTANQLSSDLSSLVINPGGAGQTTRESVGCRLASFQQESPVHRFKPAAAAPKELNDDFGDFASFESAPSSVSFNPAAAIESHLPPAITVLTPKVEAPAQDKYSALRDVFGGSSSDLHDTSSDNLIISPGLRPTNPQIGSEVGNITPNLSFANLAPSPSLANTSSEMLLSSPFNPTKSNAFSNSAAQSQDFWSLPTESVQRRDQVQPTDSWADDFGDFVEPVNEGFSLPVITKSSGFTPPPVSSGFPPSISAGFPPPISAGYPPPRSAGFPPPISAGFPPPISAGFPPPISAGFPPLIASAISFPAAVSDEDNDEFDEWSLPTGNSNERPESTDGGGLNPRRVKAFGGLTGPYDGQGATSVPFFSSSPPRDTSSPPPASVSSPGMGLEFELPSEQLKLSDQELFGTSADRTKRPAADLAGAPASLHDVINLQLQNKNQSKSSNSAESKNSRKEPRDPIDDVFINNDNISVLPAAEDTSFGHDEFSTSHSPRPHDSPTSLRPHDSPTSLRPHDSPTSLRPPSISPESASIASLEFETDQKGDERGHMVVRWTGALAKVEELVDTVANTYRNLPSDGAKQEVLMSEQGRGLLKNVREMFMLHLRINHAAKSRNLCDEDLRTMFTKINLAWNQLKQETGNSDILSQLTVEIPDSNDNDTDVCGVCLTSVANFAAKIIENGGHSAGFNVGVIAYNGCEYHAACANFWINCVDGQIPNFKCA